MLFSLFKLYVHVYESDTVLNVSRSLYCFTTSICHGVESYFPRLWGMGISDAIFQQWWIEKQVDFRSPFYSQRLPLPMYH